MSFASGVWRTGCCKRKKFVSRVVKQRDTRTRRIALQQKAGRYIYNPKSYSKNFNVCYGWTGKGRRHVEVLSADGVRLSDLTDRKIKKELKSTRTPSRSRTKEIVGSRVCEGERLVQDIQTKGPLIKFRSLEERTVRSSDQFRL